MSRSGLIATKIGNSSFFNESGMSSHVTILKVDDCIVSNVKTTEKNGYNAVQLASIETNKDNKLFAETINIIPIRDTKTTNENSGLLRDLSCFTIK